MIKYTVMYDRIVVFISSTNDILAHKPIQSPENWISDNNQGKYNRNIPTPIQTNKNVRITQINRRAPRRYLIFIEYCLKVSDYFE